MDGGFTIPIALHPGIKPDDSDGDLTRAPNRPRPTSRADFGDKTPPGAPPVIAGTLRAVLAAAPLPENSGYHGDVVSGAGARIDDWRITFADLITFIASFSPGVGRFSVER